MTAASRLLPRTLRGRLIAGLVALLAIACASVGVVTYFAVRGALTREMNSQLQTATTLAYNCWEGQVNHDDGGRDTEPSGGSSPRPVGTAPRLPGIPRTRGAATASQSAPSPTAARGSVSTRSSRVLADGALAQLRGGRPRLHPDAGRRGNACSGSPPSPAAARGPPEHHALPERAGGHVPAHRGPGPRQRRIRLLHRPAAGRHARPPPRRRARRARRLRRGAAAGRRARHALGPVLAAPAAPRGGHRVAGRRPAAGLRRGVAARRGAGHRPGHRDRPGRPRVQPDARARGDRAASAARRARPGCAGSPPTPATSCAHRSRPSAATPSSRCGTRRRHRRR